MEKLRHLEHVPKVMSLQLLREITNNFSEERKLGSGAFVDLYKGVQNGTEIAVKMFRQIPGFDEFEEFNKEIENLMRLKHQNIVQLLGYCYEVKHEYVDIGGGRRVFAQNIYRALCFEYMHNGSLQNHLSDASCGLDWQTCYRIIKGICKGLKYLHEELESPIYHLDLKPDCILLDKNMVAKLGDFSLSMLADNDQTQATESTVGTLGYMPPEYIHNGLVSNKFDIFSLGVIMIKIMSGSEGYFKSSEMPPQEFIDLVQESWRQRLQVTPVCVSLEDECHQVKRCIEIALDCVKYDRKKRPKIGTIYHWLCETDYIDEKLGTGSPHETRSDTVSHIEEPYKGLQMESNASVLHPLECMLTDERAEPINLQLSLLQSITNNFSEDMQIGTGGFAVVYKGQLQNGIVAVKKLTQTLDVHETKFHQEVDSLMRVKHKNIVRFLGYCSDTQGKVWKFGGKNVMAEERQRFLCFEFVPEGSLDKYISDASQGLDWITRYQIIKGICEGLHYLHQKNIVHLDLKPANILLDRYKVPKVADFGLSRCFDEKQTRAMTSKVYGTQGYMAPEFYDGVITLKSDIYSLGMIITEILTGQKGYQEIEDVLESWATRFGTSQGDVRLEPVRICAEIGIECSDRNPRNRPFTQHIIEKLAELERTYGFVETELLLLHQHQM